MILTNICIFSSEIFFGVIKNANKELSLGQGAKTKYPVGVSILILIFEE